MLTDSPDLTAREMAARHAADEDAHRKTDIAWGVTVLAAIFAAFLAAILIAGCDNDWPTGIADTVDVSAEG